MNNWEKVLLSPDVTLESAISVLDRGGVRIALIVDPENRLLGTLTDGDVRRALLRHMSLATTVANVMATSPAVARPEWGREKILALMESRQVLQLPIVDGQNRVVGLQTLQHLLERRQLDNPVFLMAGGFGTRLRPLTHDCPKPMLKVGDKPILELILESCIDAGFHRFYVSTHYLPEMIRDYFGDGKRWGVSISYVHEETPLGTGGALGLLPHDEIDSATLMMNGDLLTKVDYLGLLEFHKTHPGIASMCVREHEYQVPYGVIKSDGHRIISMTEKPMQRYFINAGIYLLSPELVRSVSPGTRIDMPSLLSQAMDKGGVVNMFPMHEYWLDIGRMEDFDRAQREVIDF